MPRKSAVRKLSITTNIKPSKKGWKVVHRGLIIYETKDFRFACRFIDAWNSNMDLMAAKKD